MRETCPLFGIRRCPLFGSCKCIASRGIAVGTSAVVRYSGDVRYWECPLSEVPLYCILPAYYLWCQYVWERVEEGSVGEIRVVATPPRDQQSRQHPQNVSWSGTGSGRLPSSLCSRGALLETQPSQQQHQHQRQPSPLAPLAPLSLPHTELGGAGFGAWFQMPLSKSRAQQSLKSHIIVISMAIYTI